MKTDLPRCVIVGILEDGWDGLTDRSREMLLTAGLLVGSAAHLKRLPESLAGERRGMDGALSRVADWIESWLEQNPSQHCAVLASGDPLWHGIAPMLQRKLDEKVRLEIFPALSSVQLAAARFGLNQQGVLRLSVHAGDSGEWESGAMPEHALYPLMQVLHQGRDILLLTSPVNTPARVARALISSGFGENFRVSVAAHLAGEEEALWHDLTCQEAAAMDFPLPNVVWLRPQANDNSSWNEWSCLPTLGIDDSFFLCRQPDKGLMTKHEVRAVTLAHLGLHPDSVVWDIGAGSGSVGLEASRMARHGHVYAIEKSAADVALARQNAARLKATNYTLHEARAPQGLDAWPDPDAVFIGGSGGELASLIERCLQRLAKKTRVSHRPGRLVMNFVALENLARATDCLKSLGAEWRVLQLQAAYSQPIVGMTRLVPNNPVFIVVASPAALPLRSPLVVEEKMVEKEITT